MRKRHTKWYTITSKNKLEKEVETIRIIAMIQSLILKLIYPTN